MIIELIIALLCWELLMFMYDQIERNIKYSKAENLSKEQGKKLLVIGGGFGSNPRPFKAHFNGDVCIDIDKKACKGTKEFIWQDLEKNQELPFDDNSIVVFTSHLLEHLTPRACSEIIKEIERASGGNCFVCSPKKMSLRSWVPYHRQWIRQEGNKIIATKRIWNKR